MSGSLVSAGQFVAKGEVCSKSPRLESGMHDDADSPTTEVAARENPVLERAPFLRWVLTRFSTRAHFMRFIATVIVLFTVAMLFTGRSVPDAWWGILGLTLGYYFRGATGGTAGPGQDND